MNYIILIIVFLLILILSYKLFEKDILAPSVIVSATYLFSTLAAYIAKVFNLWNYVDLNNETTFVVAIGVISFFLGEYIIRKILKKYTKDNNYKNIEDKSKIIYIKNWKIIVIYLFVIATFGYIYIQMVQITNIKNNIPEMISKYRSLTPLFNNTEKATSINTFSMQMYRATELFAYISMYILVKNLLNKDKIKNNIKYVGIIFIYILTSLFIAGRSNAFRLIVSSIISFIILYRKINNKKFNFKLLFNIIISLILVLVPLFYIIMPLIGREQSDNFSNYITFYIGSPIPSFNEIIEKNEIKPHEHFGQETFKGVQRILQKVKIIDYYSAYENQWITFNNLSSNVFTGIKEYYNDFNILGVILFQLIFSISTVYIYKYILKSNKQYNELYYIIFISCNLIDQYRSEQLFSSIITLDSILKIIYLIIIIKFLENNILKIKALNKGENINNDK